MSKNLFSDYEPTDLSMSERFRSLKGSPNRDHFKAWHKQALDYRWFGSDMDLALIEKYPNRVVAFLDLKIFDEDVTFTETILYNALLKIAPVYLLYTSGIRAIENGEFTILEYQGGDPKPNPPIVKTRLITETMNLQEYRAWELRVRTS